MSSVVMVPKFLFMVSFNRFRRKTVVSDSVSVLLEQFIPTSKVTPLKIHLKTATNNMN